MICGDITIRDSGKGDEASPRAAHVTRMRAGQQPHRVCRRLESAFGDRRVTTELTVILRAGNQGALRP